MSDSAQYIDQEKTIEKLVLKQGIEQKLQPLQEVYCKRSFNRFLFALQWQRPLLHQRLQPIRQQVHRRRLQSHPSR